MDQVDLCFAGASEQARLVRSREVTAAEVVGATLARIAEVNPVINVLNAVYGDEAVDQAAQIDSRVAQGEDLPLAGVPVALKDNLDIVGQVTSYGTAAITGPATSDSPLTATLRAAGAIIIAKSTCSELTVWPFTETKAWGASRNPWNTDYSPGGSSGGSGAAVAAGLCGLAVGSDGLGSIRVPSSFNGVFGVKPQQDRVWHNSEFNWHGMAVNGPLCRYVADAALFLDVVAGTSFRESLASPPRGLRIALAWKSAAFYPIAARLGSDQRAAVETTATALRELGHTVESHEVGFPQTMSNNYMVRYLRGVADQAETLERPEELSKATRQMAALGRRISDRRLRSALAGQGSIAAKVNRVFDDFDVVLTPGAVIAPVKVGSLDGLDAVRTLYSSGRRIPHFAPWNAIGQPAVSVPAGFSELGLPVSVQLAGQPNDEATLLGLAAQLEEVQPWATKRPSF